MAITPIQFAKTTTPQVGIDYSALSESIIEGVNAGVQAVEDKKEEISDAQSEIEQVYNTNMLQASQNGDYLNDRVVKFGEEGSLMLQELNNKYARNEITRDIWLRTKNNLLNGANQINSFIKLYELSSQKADERMKEGSLNPNTGLAKAGALDAFNQDRLGVLAQLKGHGFFTGQDGKVFFGKYGEDGKISGKRGDFITVAAALSGASQEYDNFDMAKNADYISKTIAPVIESKVLESGGLKTKEDALQSQAVQQYVQNEWQNIADNAEYLISIITDQGVLTEDGKLNWDITLDPEEAKANKNLILVKMNDTNDRWEPVTEGEGSSNYTKAIDRAREVYLNAIRARVGIKETPRDLTKGRALTAAEIKARQEAQTSQTDLMNILGMIGYGGVDTETSKTAAQELKNRKLPSQGTGLGAYTTKALEIKDGVISLDSESIFDNQFGTKDRSSAKNSLENYATDPVRAMKKIYSYIYGVSPTDQMITNAIAAYNKKYEKLKGFDKTYYGNPNLSFRLADERSSTPAEYDAIQLFKIKGKIEFEPGASYFGLAEFDEDDIRQSLGQYNSGVRIGLKKDAARNFGGYELVVNGKKHDLILTYNNKKYQISANDPSNNGAPYMPLGILSNLYDELSTTNPNPTNVGGVKEIKTTSTPGAPNNIPGAMNQILGQQRDAFGNIIQ